MLLETILFAIVCLSTICRAQISGITFRQLEWENVSISNSIDDEEPVSYYVADPNRVAVGLGCRGRRCDSMFLITAQLKNLFGQTVIFDHKGIPENGLRKLEQKLPYIQSGDNNYYYDANGLLVIGLAVRGDFSNSVAFIFSGPVKDANAIYQRPSINYNSLGNVSFDNTTACTFISKIASDGGSKDMRNYAMCPQGKVLAGAKVEGQNSAVVTPICCPISQAVPLNCQYTVWQPQGECSLKQNIDGNSVARCGKTQGVITMTRSIATQGAFGGKNCSAAAQSLVVNCDPCDKNPLTLTTISYELTKVTDQSMAKTIDDACSYTLATGACYDQVSLQNCSNSVNSSGVMTISPRYSNPDICVLKNFTVIAACTLPLC